VYCSIASPTSHPVVGKNLTMSTTHTVDTDDLRRSIEADRRQLAELTERIARQEAELAAALKGSRDDTSAAMMDVDGSSQADETSIVMKGDDEDDEDEEDDVISKVLSCTELMLLSSAILPYLGDTDLCSSAMVSMQWKGSSETDSLWKNVVSKKWPDTVATLTKAGVIGSHRTDINYLSFYRSRMRPQIVGPRRLLTSDAGDELYFLIDMPNLFLLADHTDLKPVHMAFPLSDAFRGDGSHQRIYEPTFCDCDDDVDHSHPDAWLHFPFDEKNVYTMQLGRNMDIPPVEEVFHLNVSIMRKSDGKIMKLLESSSNNCEVVAPHGYSAPWVMHKQKLGVMPNHRLRAPAELRSMAAVEADLRSFSLGGYEGYHADRSDVSFKLKFVLFGLVICEDEHRPHMVPMGSAEKLSMFLLDMARLDWS